MSVGKKSLERVANATSQNEKAKEEKTEVVAESAPKDVEKTAVSAPANEEKKAKRPSKKPAAKSGDRKAFVAVGDDMPIYLL
ncbi:MAG: hypothetical protein ACI4QR_04460 [Eubacteriales bacterium]